MLNAYDEDDDDDDDDDDGGDDDDDDEDCFMIYSILGALTLFT